MSTNIEFTDFRAEVKPLLVKEISSLLRSTLVVVSQEDCDRLANAEVDRIWYRHENNISDDVPKTPADTAWFNVARQIYNDYPLLNQAGINTSRYSQILNKALIEGTAIVSAGPSTEKPPVDRDLFLVLTAVKNSLPAGQDDFVRDLDWVANGASFRAPELRREDWGNFYMMIERHIGQPPVTEDWKIKTLALFMNMTEQGIRDMFGAKNT